MNYKVNMISADNKCEIYIPPFEEYLKLDSFNFSGTQASSASVQNFTNEVELSENSLMADFKNEQSDLKLNHEQDIESKQHSQTKKATSKKTKQQTSKPKDS